ncbi:anti-sigma factor domain-containing protein [Saccharococcus sp. Marseille-Q5394]|uniref:anti-sigma factor domain-containing protein n=1 Tax=Saccharococcus sp. Marseille-Q5394 TaxID=2972778 RepID=UPI0021C56BAA|nr:anti-sigma factor domain-containing protein [Saccharococcus sp. Marseille-Q5394]
MMRTYRGVVCEKKTTYMVFLTEKGEFLRGVPVGNPPEVGEEVEFTLVAPSFITRGKAKPRFVGAVLVAAAVLFFILSSLIPLNEKVMAYVQLDAGIAMEFGVNREGHVISWRNLNEKRKEQDLLSGWKGHSILDVLDKAISEVPALGKEITITTIYPTRESERDTRLMIGDAVQEASEKHDGWDWNVHEGTPEERKVANKKNMSIHQLKSIESKSKKHPVKNVNPVEKKPVPPQKDALQKPKKEIVPPVHPQQKKMEKEKERPHKSEDQQGPPAEKSKNKPDKERSEKMPPHADQQGPPSHSSSVDKQSKDNQGPPAKQHKDSPSNNNKQNPQNNK